MISFEIWLDAWIMISIIMEFKLADAFSCIRWRLPWVHLQFLISYGAVAFFSYFFFIEFKFFKVSIFVKRDGKELIILRSFSEIHA